MHFTGYLTMRLLVLFFHNNILFKPTLERLKMAPD